MSDLLGKTFGRNLAAFRTVEGAGCPEFAERLGVEQGYLEGLERGEVDPELTTVETLSAKLGIEPLLLLEEVDRSTDLWS